MVEEALKENTSAIRMKLGEHVCAIKKNDVLQDNKELVAYRWILESDNYLFICSFTINKEQESTVRNQDDLSTVTNLLSSVKVLSYYT